MQDKNVKMIANSLFFTFNVPKITKIFYINIFCNLRTGDMKN